MICIYYEVTGYTTSTPVKLTILCKSVLVTVLTETFKDLHSIYYFIDTTRSYKIYFYNMKIENDRQDKCS